MTVSYRASVIAQVKTSILYIYKNRFALHFCIHSGLLFDIELLTLVDIGRKTSCKIFIFMDSEIDAKLIYRYENRLRNIFR